MSAKQRLQKLKDKLKEKKLDSFLVSKQVNRFYLTGWAPDSESGFVLVTQGRDYLITDSRYIEQAISFSEKFKVIEMTEGLGPTLADIFAKEGLESLGFESHDISIFFYKRLRKFLKKVRFLPVAHLVEELRAVKDDLEIQMLRKAAQISDKAFIYILKTVRPGMSEKKIAWELEKFMRENGAEEMSWRNFIVAAGRNSSVPHWSSSENKLKKGHMVQVDFGCAFGGYRCDISRVFFLGKPASDQVEVYSLVVVGQKKGIEMVKPGINAGTIDERVRNDISKKTKFPYQHAIGHGVGLEIHELPVVSSKRRSKLAAGNVITIEPGVYVPGWGGVRIEDMVLVTENGFEILTHAPKELKEVIV